MPDIIDDANELAELALQHSLHSRKRFGPTPTGYCLTCETPLADDIARWCTPECRDDHERIVSAETRNGRRDDTT